VILASVYHWGGLPDGGSTAGKMGSRERWAAIALTTALVSDDGDSAVRAHVSYRKALP